MKKKQSFKKSFEEVLKISANSFEGILPKEMESLFPMTVKDAIVYAQIFKALKGDIHSFGLVREIIGEKAQDQQEEDKKIVIKIEDGAKELSL